MIDHSVMVDYFGTAKAFNENVEREYERNMALPLPALGLVGLQQLPRGAAGTRICR